MIKKDYHGYILKDALHDVELIIGEIRNKNISDEAEFITGHGIIKKELTNLLRDYNLDPRIQLGNSGVIVVHIE